MNIATPDYLPKGVQLFEKAVYTKIMPALLKAGLIPISPAWVMDKRNENADPCHPFWTNYWCTDFGVAGTKTHVCMLPHSQPLQALTPETPLVYGGIDCKVLRHANIYDRGELILNRSLTEEQARPHSLWIELAEGDQKRLDNLVANTFRFGKDRHGLDKMMGFFVGEDGKLRALTLYELDYVCCANGFRDLFNNSARLVGVPTDSQQATQKF